MIEQEVKSKIRDFISVLLDSKLELIEFDIYTDQKYKTKKTWYSFEVDTKVPKKASSASFGLSFSYGTQMVTFSVCIEDGCILLEKDDYSTFKEFDMEFSKECAKLIEDKYRIKQTTIIDNIVGTTNTELKLNRESNIGKLEL